VHTREELGLSDHRYRSLVEQMPAVSYVARWEPGSRFLYVSPQIEQMLGFPAERWVSEPDLWAERLHPDDREVVLMEEMRTYQHEDYNTRGCPAESEPVAPHSAFTLFGFPPRGKVARGGVGQTHHVAFRAASDEQQAEWRDHLLSLGLEVSPVMDRDYFRSIYFRAPDGLLLEIATDGPGFLVDEPRATLGTELRLPAWLAERREAIEASLAPLR